METERFIADEVCFPFDAVEDENGLLDRVYSAEDFAAYFKQFLSNGVYPNPSDGLKVNSNNSMTVTVKNGAAYIKGYMYFKINDIKVSIKSANANFNRIDIIIIRLNLVERNIKIIYKEGAASLNPVVPSLLRNDDIYELKLAEITVRVATNSIAQADILDTRLNNQVCGIVHGLVEQIDTTELFNQYISYFNQQKTNWNKAWNELIASTQQQQMTIYEWYDAVRNNIALLQSFDFDNLTALRGVSRTTTFGSNDVYELIKTKMSNKKVAARQTVMNANGSVSENVTLYAENGITIMKSVNKLTEFKTDNSIVETVDGTFTPVGTSPMVGNVRISPNMGLKIVSEEELDHGY